MKLFKGSVLPLANGVNVTLEEDTEISFPNSQVETTQIGFLQTTNNFEATDVQKNNKWRANKSRFKFNRDGNGNLLPLEEQTKEGQTVDQFIFSLSEANAELFGVKERWEALRAEKAAKKPAKPATKAAPNKDAAVSDADNKQ